MRHKQFCGAKTRRGTACQCKAMTNGRCKLHGGASTGPRTQEGLLRALSNLRQYRDGDRAPVIVGEGMNREIVSVIRY